MSSVAVADEARAGCKGILELSARLEPWQLEVCRRPELVTEWLELHGSPVNLLDPGPMARNAAGLQTAAAELDVDLRIYFARKANKALALVDEARRLGLGIDLASERELAQVVQRGVPGSALVMTAAVKPASLLERCISSGATVVIDNTDELLRLASLAEHVGQPVAVALRIAPVLTEGRAPTRFGFDLDEAIAAVDSHCPAVSRSMLVIGGVHFHLDGYDPAERVIAIGQALHLIDGLRERGHTPNFIDIGGGIPISYIDSATQWKRFWEEHRQGLLGRREPLTFEGHGLGLLAHKGEIIGAPAVYPYHQTPTGGAWLAEVLTGTVGFDGDRRTTAEALRRRRVQLRCEPGRALVDGCGLTAARVAFRKQRRDGTWLIGLEMNRTQCRSTSEDFLVDPLLIRPPADGRRGVPAGASSGSIEGYLVGAYCIERELLTWRRMRFPNGVAVGDVVIFPNTAGYLMHILESGSHQMPLARNLIVTPNRPALLDPIDGSDGFPPDRRSHWLSRK